jgi:hypothetical protein
VLTPPPEAQLGIIDPTALPPTGPGVVGEQPGAGSNEQLLPVRYEQEPGLEARTGRWKCCVTTRRGQSLASLTATKT